MGYTISCFLLKSFESSFNTVVHRILAWSPPGPMFMAYTLRASGAFAVWLLEWSNLQMQRAQGNSSRRIAMAFFKCAIIRAEVHHCPLPYSMVSAAIA